MSKISSVNSIIHTEVGSVSLLFRDQLSLLNEIQSVEVNYNLDIGMKPPTQVCILFYLQPS